jgi:hypothetical protein
MTLYLECSADETVARTLGVSRRAIIHSYGKGNVARALAKHSGVIGMVDEDMGSVQPLTMESFVEIESGYDLSTREHKLQKNRLVVVRPKLESWLIKSAKESNVSMADFGLSQNPSDLHAEINQRLSALERLLAKLLELKNPRLLALKKHLSGN